ncbi:hypothetical protein EDD37DRAFT_610221 [Exophiala viscosa]|uniref:uncharacterized protein n=1 Tax=Exophiala viscosa TaxID=2486360 RepID=UPI00219EB908|nr:hypothetical protein EDD37DRAFT_610221 [Exophiala viscosa]
MKGHVKHAFDAGGKNFGVIITALALFVAGRALNVKRLLDVRVVDILPRLELGNPEPGLLQSQQPVTASNDVRPIPAASMGTPEEASQSSSPFNERTSTVNLMEQVFRKHNAASAAGDIVDALPDSRPEHSNHTTLAGSYAPVQQLIGLALPPGPVVSVLLSSYLKNYHWHVMIFHAPTLIKELQPILDHGVVLKDRLTFLLLVLIILTIGARLDETTLESITFTLLVASYSLYNRKPRRAFKLIQAAIRDAQAIGLDRESTWPSDESEVLREHRLPLLNGSSRFESFEVRENETPEPVTILSYHRYKVRLYQIAEPITRSVYIHKRAGIHDVVKQVQQIHQRLVEWQKGLPPELGLESLTIVDIDPEKAATFDIFRLQALALQLSYDNMQLVLHRSLIAHDDSRDHADPFAEGYAGRNNGDKVDIGGLTATVIRTSRNQCWESAMRTSLLAQHPEVLELVRTTPVAAYLAMQALTAGVMLGIFSLSNPCSDRAQKAKLGISRLIQMPATVGFRDAAWQQCANILENLLRLILSEEMEVLVSGKRHSRGAVQGISSSGGIEIDQHSRNDPASTRLSSSIRDLQDLETPPPAPAHSTTSQIPVDAIVAAYGQGPTGQSAEQHDLVMPSPHPPGAQSILSPSGNFGSALTSLQSMFREGVPNIGFAGQEVIHPEAFTQQSNALDHNAQQYLAVDPAPLDNQLVSGFEVFSNPFTSFEDAGQSWLWSNDYNFF